MNGPELKAHLASLGLKHAQFARDMGVSRRAVVYWIQGARPVPSRVRGPIRRALARGYWVPPPHAPQRP